MNCHYQKIANYLAFAEKEYNISICIKDYSGFIPVNRELDLKKAARAAGDKKVELLPVKELLPLTGYLRGGCSPIGMKKKFPTFLEETAQLYEEIAVSAGQRGCQVILAPQDLAVYTQAVFSDLAEV